MKYLSVCSGIEAASVAWHPLGWQPLAFSEIEPFPRAVLAHHYPGVPCHGDFTKLRDMPFIVDADVLVGGTPCQAFSVAGLRKSLDDDRGNLSLEFVRLADAIDDLRTAGGRGPSIVVWENVPGVLSVKDNAFGCFLAGLAGDVAPYVPPRGKWTNAGVVAGPQRAVAWRVLDAQYFGLAQRRRRVFVVASARDGFDPAAVLLEFEGVRRDTPPRREAGKTTAHSTAPCLTSSGRGVERTGDTRGQDPVVAVENGSHWDGVDNPHPTLNQSAKSSGGVGASNQELFSQRGAYLVGDVTTARMVAFGEYSDDGTASTLKSRDYKDATDLVTHTLRGEGFDGSEDGTGRGTPLVPIAFHPTQDPITSTDGTSHALGCGSHNGQASVAVCVPLLEVGKRTGASTDDPRAGIGIGDDGDAMYTLQAGAQHEVAIGISGELVVDEEHIGPLDVSLGRGQAQVAYAFQPRIARNGRGDMGDVVNALNAQSGETGKGDAAPCVAVAVDCFNASVSETAQTLAHGGKGGSGQIHTVPHTLQHMAVRRLTPRECERLQGFPDDYTMIPWRGKPESPDGPRYKSLGNSMAVPCMAWIGRRIAAHLKGEI